MRTLTAAQLRALSELRERGPAHRLPGGGWTPEPGSWESGDRSFVDDYWIRMETMLDLADRGLVERDIDTNTYSITHAGHARLAEYLCEGTER